MRRLLGLSLMWCQLLLASSVSSPPASIANFPVATLVSGDILYANASGQLTRLPKGTDGYVLTLDGGVPVWASGGAGSVDYLSTYFASGDSELTFGDPANTTTFLFLATDAGSNHRAAIRYGNPVGASWDVGMGVGASDQDFTFRSYDSTKVLQLGYTDHKTRVQIVHYVPQDEPVTGEEGDCYFDSTTHKLRCYDGSAWNDAW